MGARRRARRIQPATWGLALLGAMLPFSGCVCERGEVTREALPGDDLNDPNIEPPAPAPSREIVVWDFTDPPEPALLSLWPQDSLAPPRKKLAILTTKDGGDLVARTDGPDPQFIWSFEKPLHAAVMSIELESPKEASLQLFWNTIDCRVFQEACSSSQNLGSGRQVIEFVFPFHRALRGLRLDLPGERGVKLRIKRMILTAKPHLSTGIRPREGHTQIERVAGGLRISSQEPDPWVTLATPWLEAAQVESLEVEMLAPPGAEPQLFWHGTACPHFVEECSALLRPVSGTPQLFAVKLAGVATWTGRVRGLRFDPGNAAAQYILKKLSLVRAQTVHDPAKDTLDGASRGK